MIGTVGVMRMDVSKCLSIPIPGGGVCTNLKLGLHAESLQSTRMHDLDGVAVVELRWRDVCN